MSAIVNVIASEALHPTPSEKLATNVLRVECAKRIITGPGEATHLNICVHNNSSAGRMARIVASFKQTEVTVVIPNPLVYVAPNGKTIVQAIIRPLTAEGQTNVQFNAH